jgi:hypothetical protein
MVFDWEVKKISDNLKLKFSENGIQEVLKVVNSSLIRPYPYPDPSKGLREKRKKLKSLIAAANGLKDALQPYQDLMKYREFRIYKQAEQIAMRVVEITEKDLEYLKAPGQGKGGGRRSSGDKRIIKELISIFETETHEKFIVSAATSWGRQRTQYNKAAIEFIFPLICRISKCSSKNALLKLIEDILKNSQK